MIVSLFPVIAGAGAGAAIGVSLGFLLAARGTAINDTVRKSYNPFACFFRRSPGDVILIEWFVYASAILSGCLILFCLAAIPLLVSKWLALPNGALLVVSYAVGCCFGCVAYPLGRKLWLSRA
jgi:hypothetical protein